MLAACSTLSAQGVFHVRFDQTDYQVAPGETLNVNVLIDPQPLAGLFSYGFKVVMDEALARVEAASTITVPPPLDFNGPLGAGAVRTVGTDFAAVKGTINFSLPLPQGYNGSLLATIPLKNLGSLGRSYPLRLEIYRTLGPNETVFVSGSGEDLDKSLVFDSATVHVVPEPGAFVLAMVVSCIWTLGRFGSEVWAGIHA